MKARLIVNPVAGRDAASGFLERMNARLRPHFGALDIVLTIASGDAAAAATEAAENRYEVVLSAGGDGTLNETLNGIAAVDGALERVTIGVVPLGTGNDFARALGLPLEVEPAVDAILGGITRAVDVGCVAGQRFLNTSAGGFVAEVSDVVDPQLKSLTGRLAYLIGGAQVLWDYAPVRARIALETDDGPVQQEFALQLFAVCNAPTFGGGRLIAPDAQIDDGWLDVCLVEAMPAADFVRLLPAIGSGGHLADPRVVVHRVRAARFQFDRRIKINSDGEVLEADQCDYRILPQAVRVFAPDGPWEGERSSP